MTRAETEAQLRARAVACLRAAADAIESGGDLSALALVPTCVTHDGIETFSTLAEASSWAEGTIEPGDEYHPDVGDTSWGVYVAIEDACVEVLTDADSLERAAEACVDEWWRVSLVPAWEQAPPAGDGGGR